MDPWRALQFRARHLYMDSNMIKSLGVFLIGCLCSLSSWSMTSLDDSQMEGVTGQALFQMTQTVGDTANANQNGLTFYKLGLDGTIALNANINQLNLGCGGVNGPGGCDISINQMSISGNGCANRALNCDAVMTNPYIELAISNDSTPTSRSLAGFRFSADNMSGLLSFGQNGPNPSGINTFSGYMTTTPITGTATTAATNLGGMTDTSNGGNGQVLKFWIDVHTSVNLCIFTCTVTINDGEALATSIPKSSGGVDIPSMSVPYQVKDANGNPTGATVNGTRQTSTAVTAYADIPPVSLANWGSGSNGYNLTTGLTQQSSLLNLLSTAYAQTSGTISGFTTKISFNEGLGYIHNVTVNSPFYLAFEKQAIQWPGANTADVAQRGWWMSFADPVNVGIINPTQQIDITPTFPQMAAAFINYYNQGQPLQVYLSLGQTIGAVLQQPVPVPVTATINTQLGLLLNNLQLDGHQNVVPNCMGGYKFC